jgi:ElaA protein
MTWTYKHFNELTNTELYDILHLRNIVFVVEQNCVYNDTDGKDKESWHLCGSIDNKLVAYVRILPPGVSYPEASIGRVVTHPNYRSKGHGIELMKIAIDKTRSLFNTNSIRISAQCYLLKFYSDLGFTTVGEEYLEDGIPHIEMVFA